jgi:hypothetical protein
MPMQTLKVVGVFYPDFGAMLVINGAVCGRRVESTAAKQFA